MLPSPGHDKKNEKTMIYPIGSKRLFFRSWKASDLDPFAEMSADKQVMHHMSGTMDRTGAATFIELMKVKEKANGFSLLPVELQTSGEFLGIVGLNVPDYGNPLPFDPCVEIDWRFKRTAWGNGYATEAARQWLRLAFEGLGLEEIVAFTIPANEASQRVMKRLGMKRDLTGDFLHPALDSDHPKARHVLYRLKAKDFDPR